MSTNMYFHIAKDIKSMLMMVDKVKREAANCKIQRC